MGITQLNEVRARLDELYKKRFSEKFEIITDSKPVNLAELDSKIAYLQLTSVEPHFDVPLKFENCFTKSHDLRRFHFVTPFTKEGKARSDDVTKQWMRKTIITTAHAFPYCTKRIECMAEEQVEISPSQLAIDSLAKKNRELEEVISFEPVDIKKLQLRLQGSVLVTVNAGSMAYAYAFLANNDEKLISSKDREKLGSQYRRFVDLCSTALELNEANLTSDKNGADQMYHESLKNGLVQIKT